MKAAQVGLAGAAYRKSGYLARFSRDVGYRRASPLALSPRATVQGKTRGIPHLAKNERDTRISCTRFHPAQRVRLSSKESRMKFVSPHETPQEIQGVGACGWLSEPFRSLFGR